MSTPFPGHPTKPTATRLPDGRYGVFIGAAYQFTDRAGITRLRDQLDQLLLHPAAIPAPPTDDQTGDHHTMTPDQLNQLAHDIAYRSARTCVEFSTITVADAPAGMRADPLLHGWNNLATPLAASYDRDRLADATLYLDARTLLQRHPDRPLLVRVLDEPRALSHLAIVPQLQAATA